MQDAGSGDCHLHSLSSPEPCFQKAMASFAPWEEAPHLAVAVSGGADSRALALLAQRWAQAQGGRLSALVVDHGLRPESAHEADDTLCWLADCGMDAVRLPLKGLPAGCTQEAARVARYETLQSWCRAQGVLHLLLGHHADDQAETLLLRLLAGSSWRGLAGMTPVREVAGLRLLRPLLACRKPWLAGWLRAQGHGHVEDPSNWAMHYKRTQLRRLLQTHSTPSQQARLIAVAGALGRIRMQQDVALAEALAQHVRLSEAGVAWCNVPDHRRISDMLAAMVGAISDAVHPPRRAALRALTEEPSARRTLQGCVIERHAGGWRVYREYQAVSALAVACDVPQVVWDRYRLTLDAADAALMVRAVGEAGWRQMTPLALSSDLPPDLPPDLPRRALLALPGIWQLERLLAVPHIGWVAAGGTMAATVRPACMKALGMAPFSAMNEES